MDNMELDGGYNLSEHKLEILVGGQPEIKIDANEAFINPFGKAIDFSRNDFVYVTSSFTYHQKADVKFHLPVRIQALLPGDSEPRKGQPYTIALEAKNDQLPVHISSIFKFETDLCCSIGTQFGRKRIVGANALVHAFSMTVFWYHAAKDQS